MKLYLVVKILIIVLSNSFFINKIKFIEKKSDLKNYFLHNLSPKYQSECIQILPAPKPIIKRKNIYDNFPKAYINSNNDHSPKFNDQVVFNHPSNKGIDSSENWNNINGRLGYQKTKGRKYKIISQMLVDNKNNLELFNKTDILNNQNIKLSSDPYNKTGENKDSHSKNDLKIEKINDISIPKQKHSNINIELNVDENTFCINNCEKTNQNFINHSNVSKENLIPCKSKESKNHVKEVFCFSVCVFDNQKSYCLNKK